MLKVLPPEIANLIAAGEVVGRPASVVKELMENSVDAGATAVTVSISDSGRTLIKVSDNGCGMSRDDAVLCFERHATSKISGASDLERIMTYGFRGEALASIAAVSAVTLRTRRKDGDVGTKVEAEQSGVISVEGDPIAEGTVFEVRNLFYNVPARRKFLKSDAVEMRNIVQEFLRVALTRPEMALRLISGGKDVYNLRPVQNIKQRIRDIYGMNVARELVEVNVNTTIVNVSGFIGSPEGARKRSGTQFFFVNGRYFRSPMLNKAVCKPYEKLISDGSLPAYFLYLTINPEEVDVNIHPTKTEVKFGDEGVIFEILMAGVRESLGKNDFTPSIEFDSVGNIPQIPVFHKNDTTSRSPYVPKPDYTPLFNPFDTPSYPESARSSFHPEEKFLFEEAPAEDGRDILVAHGKYILVPVKSGIMLIHVERARQRIFYERYYEKIAEQQPIVQRTLFPQTVKLSAEDCLALTEKSETVAQLGFDIRDFGGGSVVVYGVPEGFEIDESGVAGSIDALIAALCDETQIDDYRHSVAVKLAESAAATGRKSLNHTEAQLLVDSLFACREPNLSPSGHRCVTIISTDDLDKLL